MNYDSLFEKKDATALGIFRIVFAALVLIDMFRWLKIEFISNFIAETLYRTPYPFLEFLQPMAAGGMQFLFILAIVAMIMVLLGFYHRYAIGFFAVSFFYIYFSEEVIYNNHLYLIFLLSFLLIFIPADRKLSLSKQTEESVPAWCYWVLRIMFIIVYFYGGIAKLNYDWLVMHEPAISMLKAKGLDNPFMIYLVVYGGTVFDLLVGFLLLFRKTRLVAFVGVVIFNLINGFFLFDDIYIFPFLMIGATILFFPPDEVKAWLVKKGWVDRAGKKKGASHFEVKKGMMVLIGSFLVFQLIFPLKQFVFGPNIDWHKQGQRFCWRMKIENRKAQHISFKIENKNMPRAKGNPEEFVILKNGKIDNKMADTFGFTSLDHIYALNGNPRSVLECAKSLEKYFRKVTKVENLGISADIRVSYNGRPVQHFIDPEVDLMNVEYDPVGENDWILPLKEGEETN